MNFARISSSPRLRRAHDLLSDGEEHSTLEIVRLAGVCAVNSVIAELRENGAEIECRQLYLPGGERRWYYRMTRPCPDPAHG